MVEFADGFSPSLPSKPQVNFFDCLSRFNISHENNAAKHEPLPNSQWKKIKALFPEVDRLQIEIHLAYFRSERAALYTSLQTKRSIQKVQRYTAKLRHELDRILSDPIFYSADRPAWKSAPRPKRDDFAELFSALDNLDSVMGRARDRTSMKPGQKSIEPIDSLVKFLNWLQVDSSGENVQHSGKDSDRAKASKFVHLCCETVGLSKGQIDRALKRNAAAYHRALEHQGIDTALDEQVADKVRQSRGKRSRPRSRSKP